MEDQRQSKLDGLLQQIEALKSNIAKFRDNETSSAQQQTQIQPQQHEPSQLPSLSPSPQPASTGYNSGYSGVYTPYSVANSSSIGTYRGRYSNTGYRSGHRGGHRGGYRGGFKINARPRPRVRNMTLVVNNLNNVPNLAETNQSKSQSKSQLPSEGEYVSTVKRNVMQLVNKSIFEKEAQERTQKANMMALKKKILQKEIERKVKLAAFTKNKKKFEYCDWVNIYGDGSEAASKGYGLYALVNNGQKLVPLSVDPKSNDVGSIFPYGGKNYVRSTNGNLIDNNISFNSNEQVYCHFYTTTGVCQRHSTCPYKHSRDHVALCRKFISNKCSFNEQTCRLSHTPNQHNAPACLFYLNGYCSKGDSCMFAHVKTNPDAKICRPFALGGWCNRGLSCSFKHVYECPDYYESGVCPRGKTCKLNHTMRRNDTGTTEAKEHAKTNVTSNTIDNSSTGSSIGSEDYNAVNINNLNSLLDFSSEENESESDESNSEEEEEEVDVEEENKAKVIGEKSNEVFEQEDHHELEQNQDFVSF